MGWMKRWSKRLRAVLRKDAVARELDEELGFHLEMETEKNLRAGMSPEEARRQARLAFGGMERVRAEVHDARMFGWVSGMALDFKLGMRMMIRYPGLTLVGMLALTVALGLSAAWFEFTREMFSPTLPLEDGDRIVSIQNWDLERAAPERRSLHDFATWRAELRAVEDLGAAAPGDYTLTTDDGRSASVRGAGITAAGLRVPRVAPLLGRPLLEEDERAGAPPVAVIGYDLWQRLFDGDRGVIGRTVRLGSSTATVVGVMPEGFGFPVNQQVWVSWREDPLAYERGEGPAIRVFGRLAPGFSLHEAQAELTAIGQRTAAAYPETNAQLRPRVEAFVDAFVGGSALVVRSALNVPMLLLLIVICANVATLFFARTVTREAELVTRSALGASRRRLILQLFAEALVLTSTAAVVGLAAAAWGMRRGMKLFWQIQESTPPFWFDEALSFSTLLYTGALAFLSAALVGAVPALKATGRALRPVLSRAAAGGSRLRFGAASTVVIVVQVALSVLFLPIAVVRAHDALGDRIERSGFPADAYLSGQLRRQLEVPPGAMPAAARDPVVGRTAALQDEVRRRLAAEPGVTAVAFASRLPGMNHPYERVQVESGVASTESALYTAARVLAVDREFFDVMEASIVAGRGFRPADYADHDSDIGVAIVDQTFVAENLAGRNPVGLRLRYPRRPDGQGERWYEIVGVVEDLAMNAYGPGGYQDLVQTKPAGYVGVYHPLRPGEEAAVQMFLRTAASNARAWVPRIRSAITAVDPSLTVDELRSLDEVWQPAHRGERFLTGILALVTSIVVVLSAAGIYALVSFTVSRRTREIGIRTALGAGPHRILATILSRVLAQLGLGVVVGGLLFGLATGIETAEGAGLVVAMAACMMGVGLLACVLPARRALRIEPTEALRAE